MGGLVTTAITPLVLGFTFLTARVFVFGKFSDKFGPWGSLEVGMIILLIVSLVLVIGFLLAAIPVVILRWISSQRTMVCISLLALMCSYILFISGFTNTVSQLTHYPGAERFMIAVIPIHAIIFIMVSFILNRMRQNGRTIR